MYYQYAQFIKGYTDFSYNKSRKKNNLLNIELNNPYEIERIISVGKRINYKFEYKKNKVDREEMKCLLYKHLS